jgi:hypothetical protein
MGKVEYDRVTKLAARVGAVNFWVTADGSISRGKKSLPLSTDLASEIGKLLRRKKAVFLRVDTQLKSRDKTQIALYEPWSNTEGVRRSTATQSFKARSAQHGGRVTYKPSDIKKPVAKKKAPAKIKTKPEIQREYDARMAKLKKNTAKAEALVPRAKAKAVTSAKSLAAAKQANRLWTAYAKGHPFHARLTFLGTTGKGNRSQKFWEMSGPSVKDGSFLTRWGKIGQAGVEKRVGLNVAMKRAEEKIKKGYVITRLF